MIGVAVRIHSRSTGDDLGVCHVRPRLRSATRTSRAAREILPLRMVDVVATRPRSPLAALVKSRPFDARVVHAPQPVRVGAPSVSWPSLVSDATLLQNRSAEVPYDESASSLGAL